MMRSVAEEHQKRRADRSHRVARHAEDEVVSVEVLAVGREVLRTRLRIRGPISFAQLSKALRNRSRLSLALPMGCWSTAAVTRACLLVRSRLPRFCPPFERLRCFYERHMLGSAHGPLPLR